MPTNKKPISDLETKQALIIETAYETYLKNIKENVDGIAVSYVMIGYYLNQLVKDETFKKGGYESINDLAKHEFNLSDTTIRNSMNVASKYADENGQLKDEFKDYKFSALVELLPVAEEKVLIEYKPEMTVTEIRDKKKQDKPVKSIETVSSKQTTMSFDENQQVQKYPYLELNNIYGVNKYIYNFIALLLHDGYSNMFVKIQTSDHIDIYVEELPSESNMPFISIEYENKLLHMNCSDDDIQKVLRSKIASFNDFISTAIGLLDITSSDASDGDLEDDEETEEEDEE